MPRKFVGFRACNRFGLLSRRFVDSGRCYDACNKACVSRLPIRLRTHAASGFDNLLRLGYGDSYSFLEQVTEGD